MLDLVKGKQIVSSLVVVLLMNLVTPVHVWAESLDALNQKEQEAKETNTTILQEINQALDDVNQKYTEIEKLKSDIFSAEKAIYEAEREILGTEQSIALRKEVIGMRMKEIQLNGSQRTWQALLDAENLGEFFNRAYAMTLLQNAEREKIQRLSDEKEKLVLLQETIKSKQNELQKNEDKLQDEAARMDQQVAALKGQLAQNQEALKQIALDKQVEQTRIATEKAKKEAEEAAAKKAQAEAEAENNQVSANSDENPDVPADSEAAQPPAATPPTDAVQGREMYVETTAYSWREKGASNLSAMGIDLRYQSNVIAVDPRVIPLGSLVFVEGYGYAIARDTGGAIKGNIIDVHFDTVEQCIIWGRKHNVRIVIQ